MLMMADLLDKNVKYSLIDKMEVAWYFVFQSMADVIGWWAFKKAPRDEKFWCQGTTSEKAVFEKISENPKPLTQDDFIDLELWMENGGLDEYTPDPNRKFEEESEEDGNR